MTLPRSAVRFVFFFYRKQKKKFYFIQYPSYEDCFGHKISLRNFLFFSLFHREIDNLRFDFFLQEARNLEGFLYGDCI